MTAFADRLQGRLERLDMEPDDVGRAAGLPMGTVRKLLDDQVPLPRGQKLLRLAEALSTSAAYLIGLDPDAQIPDEFLEEEQGNLGLLAGDEDALLRAYRRLDVSSKAALLQVVYKMSPEPEALEKENPALPAAKVILG